MLPLLQQLVRIPSVSPGERPVDEHPTYGESRIAEFVAGFLRDQCGLTPTLEDVSPGRPAVWARLDAKPSPARTTILLEAHLDTVAPDPSAPDPFGAQARDGFVHGLGSADCKASLAAFLVAMRELSASPERLKHNLIVAGAPDEEHAMTGSRFLSERLAGQIDFAICGEPTSLIPVTAHKGVLRWRVTVEGKTAHSSTPNLGENAIYRAAPLIGAIEAYASRLSVRDADPQIGPPSASLTVIDGGTAANIVPGSCELVVDRRVAPGEDLAEAEAEFIDALASAAPREHWAFDNYSPGFAPLGRCANNEVFDVFLAALESVGLPNDTGALACATDAPNYVAHGCPSIVWGPGDVTLAHTRNERVEVAEVERAVKALVAFLT